MFAAGAGDRCLTRIVQFCRARSGWSWISDSDRGNVRRLKMASLLSLALDRVMCQAVHGYTLPASAAYQKGVPNFAWQSLADALKAGRRYLAIHSRTW